MKLNLPSPALSVALLALFVALGGTSYAAVKINGKNIKKGSIQGKALRTNTLTGSQINESKLGKVPSAASADVAASAGTATTASTAAEAGNAAKLGGSAPEVFAKGPNSLSTSTRVLPLGSVQTLRDLPGLAAINAVCSANSTSFRVTASADNVVWAGSNVAGSGAASLGSVLDTGESGELPFEPTQTAKIMLWRTAVPDAVIMAEFASVGCRTAMTLSVPK